MTEDKKLQFATENFKRRPLLRYHFSLGKLIWKGAHILIIGQNHYLSATWAAIPISFSFVCAQSNLHKYVYKIYGNYRNHMLSRHLISATKLLEEKSWLSFTFTFKHSRNIHRSRGCNMSNQSMGGSLNFMTLFWGRSLKWNYLLCGVWGINKFQTPWIVGIVHLNDGLPTVQVF